MTESFIPYRRPFWSRTDFNAATARPVRSARPSACLQEFRTGLPSAVTADVSSEIMELTDEEISERMSGNLCRCGAYVGIRAAIRQAFQIGVDNDEELLLLPRWNGRRGAALSFLRSRTRSFLAEAPTWSI